MDCPKCGAANLDRATQCAGCEAELPTPTRVRRREWFRHPMAVAIAASIAAALVAGGFALLSHSGGDVVLISVDRSQEHAFDPETNDPHTPSRNVTIALPEVPGPPGRVDGTMPGVYGRSGDGVSCNVDKLVAYLKDPAHSAQAEAWAGVIGIKRADIPAYFAKLTPVRLRFDTRVTNHDYKDGDASAFQSVLQAGTSVLVDNRGVPRAKCNCGNPLLEPRGSTSGTSDIGDFARNPEDAWDSFDPRKVATFTPGKPVKQLVLLDLDDGIAYRRKVGSHGKNDAAVKRRDPSCRKLRRSTSCGGRGPQTTPQDVAALKEAVRRLTTAVRERDCNALIDSMSAEAVAQLGIGRQQSLATCEKAFRVLGSFGGLTIDNVKVVSQRGARAVISESGTLAGEPFVGEDHLVRENGNWKLTIR